MASGVIGRDSGPCAGVTGYREAALGIARYLAARQQPGGIFPGPSFYGETFSVWLWSHFGPTFSLELERALGAYARRDFAARDSHWEFNHYALLNYFARTDDSRAAELVGRLPFSSNRTTNWGLLRQVCRLLRSHRLDRLRALAATAWLLWRRQRDGFLLDARGSRSLQYHAFSGALLADLNELTGWETVRLGFLEAADFTARLLLPDGEVNVAGRGQHQIFGQAAAIYLLEAAAALTRNAWYRERARLAFDYLLRFRREDGSFPLVLREDEPPEPWDPPARLPGWYDYNRYADYLPFLGCFLMKADAVSAAAASAAEPLEPPTTWQTRYFLRREQPRYTALLAAPGGHPANGLPFPYVVLDGRAVFPSCEGPDYPLPLLNGRSFGELLRYRLREDGLEGRGRRAVHRRRFDFSADGFVLRDEIVLRSRVPAGALVPLQLLLFDAAAVGEREFLTRGVRVETSVPCLLEHGAAATPLGHADRVREEAVGEVRAGERLTREVRVTFE